MTTRVILNKKKIQIYKTKKKKTIIFFFLKKEKRKSKGMGCQASHPQKGGCLPLSFP
jgi:aspartyl aminopeptidase